MSSKEIKNEKVFSYLEGLRGELPEIRAILLFGKNTATYKFALCHSLMNLNGDNLKTEIKYEDLSEDFVRELHKHHVSCPNQFNRKEPTKLEKAMDSHSRDEINFKRLLEIAQKDIYNNVFRAFQNLGDGTLSKKHMLFENHQSDKKLIITDRLAEILSDSSLVELVKRENQARWRVVEEAWSAGLSTNLVYDYEKQRFYRSDKKVNRVYLRSAVETLVPYQKGLCFFCSNLMTDIHGKEYELFPDVDHFFPLTLLSKEPILSVNPNGVWNLVIACNQCNRKEKRANVPAEKFYNKLLLRNERFAIEHSHGLKFSILNSLGLSKASQIKDKMALIWKTFETREKWSPK